MTETTAERRTAVRGLDADWGRAYLIFSGDGGYSATRLDNGHMLTAGSAGLLRRKIERDFGACPVPDEACEDVP